MHELELRRLRSSVVIGPRAGALGAGDDARFTSKGRGALVEGASLLRALCLRFGMVATSGSCSTVDVVGITPHTLDLASTVLRATSRRPRFARILAWAGSTYPSSASLDPSFDLSGGHGRRRARARDYGPRGPPRGIPLVNDRHSWSPGRALAPSVRRGAIGGALGLPTRVRRGASLRGPSRRRRGAPLAWPRRARSPRICARFAP